MLLNPDVAGKQNGVTGLAVQGSFVRAGKEVYSLQLKISNNTGTPLKDFVVKINNNLFGIQETVNVPASLYVPVGSTVDTKVLCTAYKDNFNGQLPQGNIITVQIALKCSADVFYFMFPVLLHNLFAQLDEGSLNKHQLF